MTYKTLQDTNVDWNNGGFNHSALIGSVMGLAKMFMPTSAKDFEEKYYRSGEEREGLIKKMSAKKRALYNDIDFLRNTESKDLPFTDEEKKLLYNKGRTPIFIERVANEFSIYAGISKKSSAEHVRTRIFEETYRGHVEELKAQELIGKMFPMFEVILSPSDHDGKYAIDLELIYKGKIIAGIQVKPRSYAQYKNDVTNKTIKLNKEKNKKFKEEFKAPVLWYYYDNRSKYDLRDFDDESKFEIKKIMRDIQ